MAVIAAEVENQQLIETRMVSLCALRWCLREVSDCFVSGILPIATIARVRTSGSQVLKLVCVFSVRVIHILVLGVHVGGTNGEIAEMACN
jgi:hypothetical protein